MHNWTIAHLASRLNKAHAMAAIYPKWQVEVSRLTARLLAIARRFEAFADLKPASRPADHCYGTAANLKASI